MLRNRHASATANANSTGVEGRSRSPSPSRSEYDSEFHSDFGSDFDDDDESAALLGDNGSANVTTTSTPRSNSRDSRNEGGVSEAASIARKSKTTRNKRTFLVLPNRQRHSVLSSYPMADRESYRFVSRTEEYIGAVLPT